MKTNKQHFLTLLRIAKKNGFKESKYYIDALKNGDVDIEHCQIVEHQLITKYHSINDIVCNFDENKVSFLKALVNACKIENINGMKLLSYDSSNSFSESLRVEWILKPTLERLNWLFETFKYLIEEN